MITVLNHYTNKWVKGRDKISEIIGKWYRKNMMKKSPKLTLTDKKMYKFKSRLEYIQNSDAMITKKILTWKNAYDLYDDYLESRVAEKYPDENNVIRIGKKPTYESFIKWLMKEEKLECKLKAQTAQNQDACENLLKKESEKLLNQFPEKVANIFRMCDSCGQNPEFVIFEVDKDLGLSKV